jgi:hypothetical protein
VLPKKEGKKMQKGKAFKLVFSQVLVAQASNPTDTHTGVILRYQGDSEGST